MNITKLQNGNLKLTADNETRADIAEKIRLGRHYWCIFADLFDDYQCNGSYTHFDASQGNPYVGLTGAPCIAETIITHDDGTNEIAGELWYFANYMIENDLAELRDHGRVIYTKAS